MSLDLIPTDVRSRFRFEQRGHACAILAGDFADEFSDLIECLRSFRLKKSQILAPGGRKTLIAQDIDAFFQARGWEEKRLS